MSPQRRTTGTPGQPRRYLGLAEVAVALSTTVTALEEIRTRRGVRYPIPDVIVGAGPGSSHGWDASRLPEWWEWRRSLAGRGTANDPPAV